MNEARGHWNEVYEAKAPTAVSWYQPQPEQSLAFIRSRGVASLIDIGGGASSLADVLLDDGFTDLAVLDISENALSHSRRRLGARAEGVTWIVADITQWRPERIWDIWHDRAVFHFLTGDADQDAYIANLKAATAPGGTVIMSTFAPDGPEKCSGLTVQRYSPQTLAARLGPDFRLSDEAAERHQTPWGATQSFIYALFERV